MGYRDARGDNIDVMREDGSRQMVFNGDVSAQHVFQRSGLARNRWSFEGASTPMRVIVCLAGATLMLSACGGRTELIALPQVGQIADNAIIDSRGGVTVVARSGTWSGPPLEGIIPLELTIDNGSPVPVRIRHRDFVLVTSRGRILPLAPPFERVDAETSLRATALAQRALMEGVLQPAAGATGFIYVSNLGDADSLDLVATFVDASTDAVIATVQMSFEVD